jgi:hypothetical protein
MAKCSQKEGNILIIAEIQDARFCGLKELAFEYAGRNGTDDRFNKEKKTPGKEWVLCSAKDEICQPDCQKSVVLEKSQAKMRFK